MSHEPSKAFDDDVLEGEQHFDRVALLPKREPEAKEDADYRARRLRAEGHAVQQVVDCLAYLEEASVHRVLNVVAQLMPQ